MSRVLTWWPIGAVGVGALGFGGLSMQLGTAIDEVRTLNSDVVSVQERLVTLEETTSQLRLDAIGAKMRAGSDRVPRPRPIQKAKAEGEGTKAKAGKAKAGKAKAKAKAKAPGEGAAKVGKGKGKAKAKAKAKANGGG